MNVFIIGTVLETAKALDKKRLNKQYIECLGLLTTMAQRDRFERGEMSEEEAQKFRRNGYRNHPALLQYLDYADWLRQYMYIMQSVYICDFEEAEGNQLYLDMKIEQGFIKAPAFHTPEFIDQMKRRLYAKDKEHYKQFAHLGESNQNWFWVDGVMRVYENGKRIK